VSIFAARYDVTHDCVCDGGGLVFFGHSPKFFLNDRKKLNQFGQNYRVINSVMASFNTSKVQMTEMSQRKKATTGSLR